ncbi:uncharacterized protein EV420DRAFT_1636563 [Desarmillaria tabescens]|uniref:Uncharacterized protein n=1 Tax=Armillaria tabescens TaxID=1929756 RepID=A0AA39U2Y8_ARMTA|nr:uncharacterized protein EV420DRAFT_1636563 [Desarmillaria tabescens]KAK0465990.1 hypothetical protein EV420DRAFT_1636563 [Desarmillaria tabescens]
MQAGLPPQITSADVESILSILDSEMNRVILAAHLQGIYSSVLAVALWTIFTQKSRPVGKVTVIVLIIVYIMAFASFSLNWSTVRSALVVNGQNVLTQITRIETPQRAVTLVTGIAGAISTILVDSIMMWRCWLVWRRQWQIVLLPALCLVAGIVFKIIITNQQFVESANGSFLFAVLYASLTLATTLLCTLLMIYRVLAIARATDRGESGLRAYRRFMEVLVESSALYAVSLILYVAFFARGSVATYYLDPIAGFTRGIAPTLLLGRVAAGHARPDDSWQGSVMTSPLRFGQDKTGKSSEDDSMMAYRGFEDDLEAQPDTYREAEHNCTDLQEDTRQCGGKAEDPSGLAEDNPEAIIMKPVH